jgi:hypothetical protein
MERFASLGPNSCACSIDKLRPILRRQRITVEVIQCARQARLSLFVKVDERGLRAAIQILAVSSEIRDARKEMLDARLI